MEYFHYNNPRPRVMEFQKSKESFEYNPVYIIKITYLKYQ